MVPLLATGKLDIGVGGIVPGLFNAYQRGTGVRVVAAASAWLPGRSNALVMRKDLVDSGRLNDYPDLKGLTFAKSTQLSTFDLPLEGAFSRGGFTANDVNIVVLGFPDMIAAFASKGIDGAFLPEPFATTAVEQGVGVRWREAADFVPNQPASLWVYSPGLVDQNPEVGRRFMLALMRGVRDYEDFVTSGKDRQDIIAALTQYTTVKNPALFDKMVMTYDPPTGAIDMGRLQNTEDFFVSHGALQQAPDLSQMVTTQFTDYAVQQLGPYQPS
jgi:NitT/TauT family transport system substrate-binding protein